jgi:hypothetical protein
VLPIALALFIVGSVLAYTITKSSAGSNKPSATIASSRENSLENVSKSATKVVQTPTAIPPTPLPPTATSTSIPPTPTPTSTPQYLYLGSLASDFAIKYTDQTGKLTVNGNPLYVDVDSTGHVKTVTINNGYTGTSPNCSPFAPPDAQKTGSNSLAMEDSFSYFSPTLAQLLPASDYQGGNPGDFNLNLNYMDTSKGTVSWCNVSI